MRQDHAHPRILLDERLNPLDMRLGGVRVSMGAAEERMMSHLPLAGEEVPVVSAVSCEIKPTSICRRADEEVDVSWDVPVARVNDVHAAVSVEVERVGERAERRPILGVEVRRSALGNDVGGDERVRVCGVPVRDECAAALANEELRSREEGGVADVVDVQVRDDDLFDIGRRRAALGKRFDYVEGNSRRELAVSGLFDDRGR